MPNKKKTTKAKAKAKRKYPCPNPGQPFTLKQIIRKLLSDEDFRKFFREQLCEAHKGSKDAIACVDSYFKGPTGDELDQLCIKGPAAKAFHEACTETKQFLIDAVAVYGGQNKGYAS